MSLEIERKFLVRDDSWRAGGTGRLYRQGYLCEDKERTVRVRTSGDVASLTIKGVSTGAARREFEYQIPRQDAQAMLDHLCLRPLIEKTRYTIQFASKTWEVDEFRGENAGLVVAEVELQSEDEELLLPPWIGEEVTGDARYYNVNLVSHPYARWDRGSVKPEVRNPKSESSPKSE